MRRWNLVSANLMAVMAFATIGCGEAFRAYTPSQNSSAEQSQKAASVAVEKAQQASLDAQTVMQEAQVTLRGLQDANGNIKLDLFMQPGLNPGSAGLGALTAKIREVFDQVFEKVADVRARYTEARLRLSDFAAKLDPNNPAEAELLAQLQKQLEQVDALEAKFLDGVQQLAGKLDLLTQALDNITNRVTLALPGWGSLVGLALDYFVMSDVKSLILELKAKLLAL